MSFTSLQRLIAQITLEAIADLGFALGGGTRPSSSPASAADLAAAGDQDPEDYHAYGLSEAGINRLAADFTQWAAELRTRDIDGHDA